MNYSEVYQALDSILTQKRTDIEQISQFAGGWEGWLQSEMILKWQPGKVFREQNAWDDRREIDLWFPDTRYGVELKCFGLNRSSRPNEIISTIDSTYTKFANEVMADVEKLRQLSAKGLGIVVIPTWLPNEAITKIKNALTATFTWTYMGNTGFIVGLHSNDWL